MKTLLVTFLASILASVAAAEDIAAYYATVESVHERAVITVAVEGRTPSVCRHEFWGQGEAYRIDLYCSGGGSGDGISGSIAYDGERTRMRQGSADADSDSAVSAVPAVVQSTVGNVMTGPGTAFGPPTPFFMPLLDHLDLTENWSIGGARAAIRWGHEPCNPPPTLVMDDVKAGFPWHMVLTAAEAGVRYEAQITDLDINKGVDGGVFVLDAAAEARTEDIAAELEWRKQ